MSAFVQVFGRRNAKTIHARRQPASEKRQGTKSRSVVQRRCGVRYGDFAAGLGLKRLDRSGLPDGFAPSRGCACGVNERSARFTTGLAAPMRANPTDAMRAGRGRLESQREWRVSLAVVDRR